MQAKRLTVNQGQKAEQVEVEVPKIPEKYQRAEQVDVEVPRIPDKYRFPMPPGHDKSSEEVGAQDDGKEVVIPPAGLEVVEQQSTPTPLSPRQKSSPESLRPRQETKWI